MPAPFTQMHKEHHMPKVANKTDKKAVPVTASLNNQHDYMTVTLKDGRNTIRLTHSRNGCKASGNGEDTDMAQEAIDLAFKPWHALPKAEIKGCPTLGEKIDAFVAEVNKRQFTLTEVAYYLFRAIGHQDFAVA